MRTLPSPQRQIGQFRSEFPRQTQRRAPFLDRRRPRRLRVPVQRTRTRARQARSVPPPGQGNARRNSRNRRPFSRIGNGPRDSSNCPTRFGARIADLVVPRPLAPHPLIQIPDRDVLRANLLHPLRIRRPRVAHDPAVCHHPPEPVLRMPVVLLPSRATGQQLGNEPRISARISPSQEDRRRSPVEEVVGRHRAALTLTLSLGERGSETPSPSGREPAPAKAGAGVRAPLTSLGRPVPRR